MNKRGLISTSGAPSPVQPSEITMLYYAIVFFMVAMVAGVFGFTGIASGVAGIAQILSLLFVVMAVISFIVHAIADK